MLPARCGAMVSGIAGFSSRGISGKSIWTPHGAPASWRDGMSDPIGAQPTGPLPKGPLRGLRVLDLSRVLAGRLHADAGRPRRRCDQGRTPRAGDDTRGFAPPSCRARGERLLPRHEPQQALDHGGHRAARGAGDRRQLVAQCDMLVENFKVGELAKYGLGYEQLHAKFPRLIYCSITGFGQTGPTRRGPAITR